MKPILFEANETQFLTRGLGTLSEAISCEVEEERNGVFLLRMEYPVSGQLYSELTKDRIILAKCSDTMQEQPFRIVVREKAINGITSIEAEHLSYQTNSIPVFPFTANNCPAAVSGMKNNSATANPFIFTTTKTTTGAFSVKEPTSFRQLLGGVNGSLLDVYGGGEYTFDRWVITLQNNRGQDRGVVVSYGKNLLDFEMEDSISNLITGVAPYWTDSEGALVTLPEKTVQIKSEYAYPRVAPLDLSDKFEEAPSVEALRKETIRYIESTDLTTPKVSWKVNFIELSKTDQYKDVAALERVSLCDTVTVRVTKLDVDAKAKVIRTVYDVINERYTEMDLGDARADFTQITLDQQHALDDKPSEGFMAQAILNATLKLTGNKGGYVVFDPPPPAEPQEIFIMDKPSKVTATRVWRWNLNGLGYSGTGINGPYRLAITTDPGAIVADFITAGTLNAALAKVINLDASSINTGTLDASVVNVKNLNASSITSGTIDASKIAVENLNASSITSGTFSANRISGGTINGNNVNVTNLNASNITTGIIQDAAGVNSINMTTGDAKMNGRFDSVSANGTDRMSLQVGQLAFYVGNALSARIASQAGYGLMSVNGAYGLIMGDGTSRNVIQPGGTNREQATAQFDFMFIPDGGLQVGGFPAKWTTITDKSDKQVKVLASA